MWLSWRETVKYMVGTSRSVLDAVCDGGKKSGRHRVASNILIAVSLCAPLTLSRPTEVFERAMRRYYFLNSDIKKKSFNRSSRINCMTHFNQESPTFSSFQRDIASEFVNWTFERVECSAIIARWRQTYIYIYIAIIELPGGKSVPRKVIVLGNKLGELEEKVFIRFSSSNFLFPITIFFTLNIILKWSKTWLNNYV